MRRRHCILVVLLLVAAISRTSVGATLWLYNVHSKEELRLPALSSTSVDLLSWRRANRFFRSRRTQTRRAIHPRLLRTLAHVQQHFGGRLIMLVSGYRMPAKGELLNSYHQVGRAADLRIPGVSKEELFAYCRTLEGMGCGYYPRAKFVHFDVRGRSTVWVDLSAPGQPRNYAESPRQWLRARGL